MGSAAMNLRLAASRSLMIFFAITTSLVAYTDAVTSSTECADEGQACYISDTVCSACMMEYDTDQFAECYEDAFSSFISDITAAENACEVGSLIACCVDAASTNDCMSNDAFVDLNLCIYSLAATNSGSSEECTTLTCSEVDGVDDPEVLGANGAFRADVFSVRALLSFALGVSMFVRVSL
ncbi:unnamed protein product [Scytosiphon promiscuus]